VLNVVPDVVMESAMVLGSDREVAGKKLMDIARIRKRNLFGTNPPALPLQITERQTGKTLRAFIRARK
jgi:hypothetical protein